MRQKIQSILQYALYGALGIQCLFGVLWLMGNLGRVQEFGLADSYIKAGTGLLEKEGIALPMSAGVLYEWIVGATVGVDHAIGLPGMFPYLALYLCQLVALFCAIKYALDVLCVYNKEKRNWLPILGAMACISIPEVMQSALCVLPNTLASAGLLTMGIKMLQSIRRIRKEKEINRKRVAYMISSMGAFWTLSALLMPEYGYFGLIFMLTFLLELIRHKKLHFETVLVAIAFPLITSGIYYGMTACGRSEKQENGVMLSAVSRFVGPDFQHNHNNWPEEFKAIIDWETAGNIALNTDGTWTVMQPIMRQNLSEKECDRIYLALVKKAMLLRKKSIVGSVSLDTLSYLFTPYFTSKQLDGVGGDSFSGRNYEIMKAKMPFLTKWYVRYGGFCFLLCMLVIFFDKVMEKTGTRKADTEELITDKKDVARSWWITVILMSIYYTMLGYGRMDYKLSVFIMILWVLRALDATNKEMNKQS